MTLPLRSIVLALAIGCAGAPVTLRDGADAEVVVSRCDADACDLRATVSWAAAPFDQRLPRPTAVRALPAARVLAIAADGAWSCFRVADGAPVVPVAPCAFPDGGAPFTAASATAVAWRRAGPAHAEILAGLPDGEVAEALILAAAGGAVDLPWRTALARLPPADRLRVGDAWRARLPVHPPTEAGARVLALAEEAHHFAGEEPYDEARAAFLATAIETATTGARAGLAVLRTDDLDARTRAVVELSVGPGLDRDARAARCADVPTTDFLPSLLDDEVRAAVCAPLR